ncbi:hypothetical protein BT96DRAFT_172812 [Gymnopus androsaceus JB14]|uniref:Uncharacterized protein n=1 Tax=Gymnopus androsaceus JB14 TaxID=1447944 RepID=A0A6A4ICJ2_9AGAR|nr:hypothetical protein BT96DRAFT_172812 [Gymnopus androsaceus JB14]
MPVLEASNSLQDTDSLMRSEVMEIPESMPTMPGISGRDPTSYTLIHEEEEASFSEPSAFVLSDTEVAERENSSEYLQRTDPPDVIAIPDIVALASGISDLPSSSYPTGPSTLTVNQTPANSIEMVENFHIFFALRTLLRHLLGPIDGEAF